MNRPKKQGRKRGSRNRGFFFRKGRGWCTSEGTRAIPLRLEDGQAIRDHDTPVSVLRAAYNRYLKSRDQLEAESETEAVNDSATVLETCQLYLSHCQATGAASTYEVRADALYEFCFGLPAVFRKGKKSKQEEDAARKARSGKGHKAYGILRVEQLKPLHVDQWLAANKTWKGCRRTKIQALKRALNYGVESKFIGRNPIKGYKTPKAVMRKTYLTPEQELACYRLANPALALAMKTCIRTGARFGCEFIKLTAKHVRMTPKGMEWRFSEKESKTGKLRIIRIPSSEATALKIINVVKRQMEKFPSGALFRNSRNEPWSRHGLSGEFTRLRKKLAAEGIDLDDDACMYSCRHTYAKRTLSGFWSGKPSTIERLAELMGNSRDVCWEHYASWCDAYTDPLWESA